MPGFSVIPWCVSPVKEDTIYCYNKVYFQLRATRLFTPLCPSVSRSTFLVVLFLSHYFKSIKSFEVNLSQFKSFEVNLSQYKSFFFIFVVFVIFCLILISATQSDDVPESGHHHILIGIAHFPHTMSGSRLFQKSIELVSDYKKNIKFFFM